MKEKKRALIVVDVQNDFLPGGALGINKADEIIPVINRLLSLPFQAIVATQDWHPAGHCSFATAWQKPVGSSVFIESYEQTLWPDHCIQGSRGAEFSNELDIEHFSHIVHKGTEKNVDSYSTFFDNEMKRSTGLEAYLHDHKVKELYFAGLATEYCVLYSVMDALDLGFHVHVITDACKGIDLNSGDVEKALKAMKEKGVKFITSQELIHEMAHAGSGVNSNHV